jgi:AraC family transcriptional regulator
MRSELQQSLTASATPMNSLANTSPTSLSARYPGNSRRILAQFKTSSIHIDEALYAPGFCMARHCHEHAELACSLQGVHWSLHSNAGYTCRPGTLRFLPAGEPHENYFPNGARCLRIELRSPILDRAREYGAALSMPGELATPAAATLSRLLFKEFRYNDDLSALSIEGLSLLLLEASSNETAWPEYRLPQWLGRIREMLHEEIASRLTLAELAACAGRHPVQVCRQFHRRFRCTIGEYVRRLRVGRAQSLLTSSELGLAEIALACGFSDQSHFTRAFRRLTGMPPRQYRKQNTR